MTFETYKIPVTRCHMGVVIRRIGNAPFLADPARRSTVEHRGEASLTAIPNLESSFSLRCIASDQTNGDRHH